MSEGARKVLMAHTISYNPENSKKLREQACALSEYQQTAQAEIQVATQEGDLDKARGVLEAATLRIKEYENFRESLSKEELLLAKYGVEVINEHTILFVIPKGTSRISILEEANKLVLERDGRDLITPHQLPAWQKDKRFTKEQEASKRLCIDGHVQGVDGKTREEHEAFLNGKSTLMKKAAALLGLGLKEPFAMPEMQDLAVAFSLHWVATGEPLFEEYAKQNGWSFAIRCVGGALGFGRRGLGGGRFFGGSDGDDVGVSALVSPE